MILLNLFRFWNKLGKKEQIKLKSVRLYSNGKEVGENEFIVYI